MREIVKNLMVMSSKILLNPFSATSRDSCHQNKIKVKGLGTKSSYVAGFSIFFFFFMIL